MDWYLHRQVIGQLGPVLVVVSLLWLLVAYFYFDPLVALGIAPVSKASWGEFPNEHYFRAARTSSILASGTPLGMYFALYWRARRGERVSPTHWRMYVLLLGGVIVGASVYVVLRNLLPA